MSSSRRDSEKKVTATSSKQELSAVKAFEGPKSPGQANIMTRTLARSAVSMLVLAGLLSGQALAGGAGEAGLDDLQSTTALTQPAAKSAPTGLVGNLMDFSMTPNMRGAQTAGSGLVEIGEALGHVGKGLWAQGVAANQFLDGLGFGMGKHQHIMGKMSCLGNSCYEEAKFLGHFGAAGIKSLKGLSKIAQGQLQLAYDNPKYAGLLTAGLVAADAAMGDGSLLRQLVADGKALTKGLNTLGKTLGNKDFWQQSVSCSGLGDKIEALGEYFGECPANPTVYDSVATSLRNLPFRLATGAWDTNLNFWQTGADVMAKGTNTVGQIMHHYGVDEALKNGAKESLRITGDVVGKAVGFTAANVLRGVNYFAPIAKEAAWEMTKGMGKLGYYATKQLAKGSLQVLGGALKAGGEGMLTMMPKTL